MEAPLAFLVKDRRLDERKRQWIRSNVRKRECVSFVPLKDTSDENIYSEATEDRDQSVLCRCGRIRAKHVKLGQYIRSRDYRQFSEDFATDVYLDLINSEASVHQPVTYAPKQVIRLAADHPSDTLRHLIGPIWRMPKANFLLSVIGTSKRQSYDLSENLASLFVALANPGNAIVSVSTSDPDLCTLTQEACQRGYSRLHPTAEILPIVFHPWTQLTTEQKQLLIDATKAEKTAEDADITTRIPLLTAPKGYFFLADYGVHSYPGRSPVQPTRVTRDSKPYAGETGSRKEEHRSQPGIDATVLLNHFGEGESPRVNTKKAGHSQPNAESISPVSSPLDPSAAKRGSSPDLSPPRLNLSDGSASCSNEDAGKNNSANSLQRSPTPDSHQGATAYTVPDDSPFPLAQREPYHPHPPENDAAFPIPEESSFPFSQQEAKLSADYPEPPPPSRDQYPLPDKTTGQSEFNSESRPPLPPRQRRSPVQPGQGTSNTTGQPGSGDEARNLKSNKEQEERDTGTVHEETVRVPNAEKGHVGSETERDANRISDEEDVTTKYETKRNPADEEGRPQRDSGRYPHHTGSVERGEASGSQRRPPGTSGARVNIILPTGPFFNFTFPSPLRRTVETVLRDHCRDPAAHGSLVIVCGDPSFVDLASVHGAVMSGVPVVIAKSHRVEALQIVLQELDQLTGAHQHDPTDRREKVVDEASLKTVVQKHKNKFKDFQRYGHQIERVLRDVLRCRHLLTLCDLSDTSSDVMRPTDRSNRLLHAAVEAFMKSMTEDEARVFFRKHTRRLAAEVERHPVKKAQRAFQEASVACAVRLNRPEVLDIIFTHGFVTTHDVFSSYMLWNRMTEQDKKDLKEQNATLFSKMKNIKCSELREHFVEQLCDLKIDSKRDLPVVQKLFLFAVINGRTSLAKLFWKREMFPDQVANALIASHVSTLLADLTPEGNKALKDVFTRQAAEFTNLATGTLNDCFLHDPEKARDIVYKTAEGFAISPIAAAILFNIRAFVAEPAAAAFLNTVWEGKVTEETISAHEHQRHNQSKYKKCADNRCVKFFNAPRVKYSVSTFFYVAFLTLFGHTLIFGNGGNGLSPLDMAVLVWAGAFLFEEVMQCFASKTFLLALNRRRRTLRGKLLVHFSDYWNIVDAVALALLVLGYILRVTVEPYEAGHVILSVTYILFFLRVLRFITISQSIGPMLPMIVKMVGDLIPFLVVLFVFSLSYGIASQALLHPGTSWHALYFLYLPRVAFWPIFGEYGFDAIDGADCTNSTLWYTQDGGDVTCPAPVGRHVVPVLLGVYILMSNVLLLNLVIAKFNNSFEEVNKEAKVWWAWLRCALIVEYYGYPALAPPLSLLYRLYQVLKLLLMGLYHVLCCIFCCGFCTRQKGGGGAVLVPTDETGFRMKGIKSESRGDDDLQIYEMASNYVRHDVAELYNEDADLLDCLELEDFRFSLQGPGAVVEIHLPLSGVEAPRDETSQPRIVQLRQFEARKASSYLSSQDAVSQPTHSSPTHRRQEKDGLESALTRLETKLEETRARLHAMDALLHSSVVTPAKDKVQSHSHQPETVMGEKEEREGPDNRDGGPPEISVQTKTINRRTM